MAFRLRVIRDGKEGPESTARALSGDELRRRGSRDMSNLSSLSGLEGPVNSNER